MVDLTHWATVSFIFVLAFLHIRPSIASRHIDEPPNFESFSAVIDLLPSAARKRSIGATLTDISSLENGDDVGETIPAVTSTAGVRGAHKIRKERRERLRQLNVFYNGARGQAFKCLDVSKLCDRIPDCPGAEDEDLQSCMFYKAASFKMNKLHAIVSELVMRGDTDANADLVALLKRRRRRSDLMEVVLDA